MIHGLVENFLLGFAITALPGAVFFETVRRSLSNNASIYKFLAGTFAGTFIIIIFVILGLSSIFTNKSMASLFYVLSGSVLIYVGVMSFVSRPVKPKLKRDTTAYSAFLTGLTLSLANPINILFWISIIGKTIQKNHSLAFAIANSLSVVVGAVCLFVVVITLTNFVHTVSKPRNILILSRFFGILIFVYGLLTINKAL